MVSSLAMSLWRKTFSLLLFSFLFVFYIALFSKCKDIWCPPWLSIYPRSKTILLFCWHLLFYLKFILCEAASLINCRLHVYRFFTYACRFSTNINVLIKVSLEKLIFQIIDFSLQRCNWNRETWEMMAKFLLHILQLFINEFYLWISLRVVVFLLDEIFENAWLAEFLIEMILFLFMSFDEFGRAIHLFESKMFKRLLGACGGFRKPLRLNLFNVCHIFNIYLYSLPHILLRYSRIKQGIILNYWEYTTPQQPFNFFVYLRAILLNLMYPESVYLRFKIQQLSYMLYVIHLVFF